MPLPIPCTTCNRRFIHEPLTCELSPDFRPGGWFGGIGRGVVIVLALVGFCSLANVAERCNHEPVPVVRAEAGLR